MATSKKRQPAPAEGEALFDVLSNLDLDGTLHVPAKPGEDPVQVALDEGTAAELIKLNVVRAVRAVRAAAAEKPATEHMPPG